MFRVSTFDKLLDKATSNLRLEPDWPSILQICDLIRQNDCNPKHAVGAIKKKLYSTNPHQAMFALLVLESIVKNCGSGVHDEISTKTNCEMLRDLVKTTQHENLKAKVLELIQAWAFAFRNNPKYRAVQDTVNIMKAEGYKFPALKESDAMFSAYTAPQWSDGEVCHRCRVGFSLLVRKHHCRACGQVFCQQCSSKTSTIPKFGIEKEVRVCDACYDKVSRPPTTKADSVSEEQPQQAPQRAFGKKHALTDLRHWYKPSTSKSAGKSNASRIVQKDMLPPGFAQVTSVVKTYKKKCADNQQQKPPGKTAEELQEEEELQLALALSQSEAEQKEKERRSYSAPPLANNATAASAQRPVGRVSPVEVSGNSELSRYLDRAYWEQRNPTAPTSSASDTNLTQRSPTQTSQPAVQQQPQTQPQVVATSAIDTHATAMLNSIANSLENGSATDTELEEFVSTLRSQIDIFVNRMKSNSSRGRSIANDTSVQTLFMNITALHSKLLRHIQKQDDERVYYERLQDKVSGARECRAALDTLREENAERRAREAEAAERQRQLQMAAKLEAMRRKKHEYLEYQRQLALRRVRDTEMQLQQRQEQQKQQYMTQHFYPPFAGQFRGPPQFNQSGPQSMPMMMPSLPQQQMMMPPQQQQMMNNQPPISNPTSQMPVSSQIMTQPQSLPHNSMNATYIQGLPSQPNQIQQPMPLGPQSIPNGTQVNQSPQHLPKMENIHQTPSGNVMPNVAQIPPNVHQSQNVHAVQGMPQAPPHNLPHVHQNLPQAPQNMPQGTQVMHSAPQNLPQGMSQGQHGIPINARPHAASNMPPLMQQGQPHMPPGSQAPPQPLPNMPPTSHGASQPQVIVQPNIKCKEVNQVPQNVNQAPSQDLSQNMSPNPQVMNQQPPQNQPHSQMQPLGLPAVQQQGVPQHMAQQVQESKARVSQSMPALPSTPQEIKVKVESSAPTAELISFD